MAESRIQEIVLKGSWLYDNSIKKAVRILRQNWDQYYEEGYSEGGPHLNEDGFAYYVAYDEPSEDGSYFSKSETLYSLQEAINKAEEKTSGKISWE